jgi:hypothetical protein
MNSGISSRVTLRPLTLCDAIALAVAAAGNRRLNRIQVPDLNNGRKGNLHDFPVGTFNFDAWCGQRLRSFHAANDPADALAINGGDFNIVFAV